MLQMRLGIKPLIDSLPWKHEELVAEARQHPLEFQQMTLMLSSARAPRWRRRNRSSTTPI